MADQITFETKCYEGDWQFLIKRGRLERMIGNCEYDFEKRILYINNVDDYKTVLRAADQLVSKNIITEYCVVKDYEKQVLEHFQLTKESFKGGYYYSIAELTSIWRCDTEFLLHFSGDSILEQKQSSWIRDALDVLRKNPSVAVANAVWDFKYEEAKAECFREDKDWFYSFGFSDQCYLIRPGQFKKPVYGEQNEASSRYPIYGGELFEKRVDAWMRNHSLFRITSKHISYRHQNFPKDNLRKFTSLYLGYPKV